MSLSLTTELDAVNTMLATIGESPVSSLEVAGLTDVAIAKQVLTETSRAVQSKGWHFNTEVNYPLARTIEGYVNVPLNTLRVDTTGYDSDVDVVQRGIRLYDRANHTYVFDRALTADLVLYLAFDELPEAARYYITIRAARVFQRRVLSSETVESFTQEEEMYALVALSEAEGDTADSNVLSGNYSAAFILER